MEIQHSRKIASNLSLTETRFKWKINSKKFPTSRKKFINFVQKKMQTLLIFSHINKLTN